jgi:hypothetical protein
MDSRTSSGVYRTAGIATVLLAALPFLTGCATSHPGALPTSQTEEAGAAKYPPDPNWISEYEIDQIEFHSAYGIIEVLRPQWLRTRGVNSITGRTSGYADVFMDGQFVGGLDYLRNVSAMQISGLRFWGPGQAGVRFGMGYPRGVVEITSKGLQN